MLPSKKHTAKQNKNTKLTPVAPFPGEIQWLFQLSQSGSPEFKMADSHASHSAGLDPLAYPAYPASPTGPLSLEIYPNTPPPLLMDLRNSPHLPLTYRADVELKSILQALPTKADIEALIGCVEATHRKELRAIKQEVHTLTTRLTAGGFSVYNGPESVCPGGTPKLPHRGNGGPATTSGGDGGPELKEQLTAPGSARSYRPSRSS